MRPYKQKTPLRSGGFADRPKPIEKEIRTPFLSDSGLDCKPLCAPPRIMGRNMNSDGQTIFRIIDGAFTTLSNKPLQDKRLSLEARGLLASVLSFPRDWSFNRAWAQREFSVGRDKLDRIIGELKSAGYIRFIQDRGEGGRLGKGAYYFAADPRSFDDFEPLPAFQGSGAHRDTGLPEAVEPSPANKDTYKENSLPKETDLQSALPREVENVSSERWLHRLTQWRARSSWPASWGGSPPGKPGCIVPEEVLKLWKEQKSDVPVRGRRQGKVSGMEGSNWQRVGLGAASRAYKTGAN